MGEFSPVQLDALEDALEDLELSGIPGELEGDLAVAGRLGEYRDLLALSREALPPVDVPTGILDGVLAAAREEAVAVPDTPRRAEADDAAKSWWQRFSLWMPMLAVGASAALVLIMVRGTLSGDAEPAATVARADAEDAKMDDAPAEEAPAAAKTQGAFLDGSEELQAVAEPAAAVDEDGLALGGLEQRGRLRGSAAVEKDASDLDPNDDAFARDGEAEDRKAEENKPVEPEVPAEAEPEPESEPPVAPEPTDKVVYDGDSKGGAKKKSPPRNAKPKAKPSKPSSSTSGKKSEPKPAGGGGIPGGVPGGVPDSAKESDPLAAAERNRKQGRCGSARSVYRSHIDDSDASLRARALAGMGLCALADGDEKAADDYFKRAKAADGGVSSFISRERSKVEGRSTQAQTQKKK